VFDLYRFGRRRDDLVRAKLDALIATDKEIRTLEALLGFGERVTEIRVPGVGGTCPSCNAFHAREAKFCDRCGAELGAASPTEVPLPEPVPEPDGEVTVVRQADQPAATEAPAHNGAVPNGSGPSAEAEPAEPEHAAGHADR
jgi:hypothetical protein